MQEGRREKGRREEDGESVCGRYRGIALQQSTMRKRRRRRRKKKREGSTEYNGE